VAKAQAQAQVAADPPLILDERTRLVLREVPAERRRLAGVGIDRQRLTERPIGGKVGEAVEGKGASLRRSQAQRFRDPAPLEANPNRMLAAIEGQDVA
jgi:hypothetical protein